MIQRVRDQMEELPDERRSRFVEYGLSIAQAAQLTSNFATSTFALSTFTGAPKSSVPDLANWIVGPLSAKLNDENLSADKSRVSADQLRTLSERIEDGTLSGKMAKEVFDAVWAGEGGVDAVIEKHGLKQISDSGEIEKIIDEVLAANAKQVEDYRSGKEKAFNSLVGQVMKRSQGKANPAQVNEILRSKLKAP
jgi:aspartyl-tRNA(Asn)/glutamyl-tRNA(Gln) amidotransferase subunit B